jgi:hypothetical protein
MSARARSLLLLAGLALVAACSPPAGPDAGDDDAGMLGDAGSLPPADGGVDAGVVDAGLPPYGRTLLTRPLMPTSPKNLLRDPFIGGDGDTSYGQFRAFFDNAADDFPLSRTFQSVSPIGGADSIEELRNLPPDAGALGDMRVMSSFHGGAGDFSASLWLSAGDATAAPVPFATASSKISATLIDNSGTQKIVLQAGTPQTFGAREWVQLTTHGTALLPAGGWLMVTLTDAHFTLQLAAPEVTTTGLAGQAHARRAVKVPMSADEIQAREHAMQIDRRVPEHPLRRRRH